jgi:transcription elongation factor Elf1
MSTEKKINVDALVECPHCLVYSINSDDYKGIAVATCQICGTGVPLEKTGVVNNNV